MTNVTHLQVIFMAVIAVEIMLFFVMNGTDFGAGIATAFVKDQQDRNEIVKTSEPVWGGNETWIVAGLALMFGTFPGWYAALESGYYLFFIGILFFFILRGVAFDYRNAWQKTFYNRFWDWGLFLGSLLPPFLFGIILSSMVSGVPMKDGFVYAGFGDVVTLFSLLGGILAVVLSINIGLSRVIKKVSDPLVAKLQPILRIVNIIIYPLAILFIILLPFKTNFFSNRPAGVTVLLIVMVAALVVQTLVLTKHPKANFWLAAVVMGAFALTIFVGIFPNLIISTTGPNLTAPMAASGRESLLWAAWLMGFAMPIMIIVQAYSYHLINKFYNTPASPMTY